MKKFNRMKLPPLRNNVHVTYHEAVSKKLSTMAAAKYGYQAAYNKYTALYDKEVAALDTVWKSTYTDLVYQQDKVRTQRLRGLWQHVKGGLDEPDPKKVEAARKLSIVMTSYRRIYTHSFDQRTAVIDDLNRELDNAYATEMSALGLGEWTLALAKENEIFKQLMQDRDDDQKKAQALNLKPYRLATDAAYRALQEKIEALVLAKETDDYDGMIDAVNSITLRYLDNLAHPHEHKDANDAKAANKTAEQS